MTHYCKSHTTTQSTRDTPRCEEAARKIAHSYICYDRCQQLLHDLPLPAQPGPICTRRLTHWHRPPIHRLLSGPIRRTSSSRPHSPRPRRPVHPVPSDSARQDASRETSQTSGHAVLVATSNASAGASGSGPTNVQPQTDDSALALSICWDDRRWFNGARVRLSFDLECSITES